MKRTCHVTTGCKRRILNLSCDHCIFDSTRPIIKHGHTSKSKLHLYKHQMFQSHGFHKHGPSPLPPPKTNWVNQPVKSETNPFGAWISKLTTKCPIEAMEAAVRRAVCDGDPVTSGSVFSLGNGRGDDGNVTQESHVQKRGFTWAAYRNYTGLSPSVTARYQKSRQHQRHARKQKSWHPPKVTAPEAKTQWAHYFHEGHQSSTTWPKTQDCRKPVGTGSTLCGLLRLGSGTQ